MIPEKYTLHVAGLTRELGIFPVSEKLYIAGFVMLGDYELAEACARELLKKLPEHDVLLTAESKGIPLVHEMARQAGEKKHVVARKGVKAYMKDPIGVEVNSITTAAKQKLYLDRGDMEYIRGRRVAIVDDVISTGESLRTLETLVNEAGGVIAAKAAVLAEGDAADRKDIIYLEKLPLFFK